MTAADVGQLGAVMKQDVQCYILMASVMMSTAVLYRRLISDLSMLRGA